MQCSMRDTNQVCQDGVHGIKQGGITPIADSVMCMSVTINFAT